MQAPIITDDIKSEQLASIPNPFEQKQAAPQAIPNPFEQKAPVPVQPQVQAPVVASLPRQDAPVVPTKVQAPVITDEIKQQQLASIPNPFAQQKPEQPPKPEVRLTKKVNWQKAFLYLFS